MWILIYREVVLFENCYYGYIKILGNEEVDVLVKLW